MSPEMLRIGKWFGRRPNTKWSDKEIRALKITKDTPDEDWDALEVMYTSSYPYKRRDIYTLLNNWPSEIDKARNQAEENGTSFNQHHECIPMWKYEVMNIIRLTVDDMPEHIKMRYEALPQEAKDFLYGVASEAQRKLLKK